MDPSIQHETLEEGRNTYRPKRCENSNKDEVISPNILSNNNDVLQEKKNILFNGITRGSGVKSETRFTKELSINSFYEFRSFYSQSSSWRKAVSTAVSFAFSHSLVLFHNVVL